MNFQRKDESQFSFISRIFSFSYNKDIPLLLHLSLQASFQAFPNSERPVDSEPDLGSLNHLGLHLLPMRKENGIWADIQHLGSPRFSNVYSPTFGGNPRDQGEFAVSVLLFAVERGEFQLSVCFVGQQEPESNLSLNQCAVFP